MAAGKRRKRLSFRSPRSILTALLLLAATAIYNYASDYFSDRENRAAESGESPAALFAVFARLNVDPEQVQRMRASPTPPTSRPAGATWRTIERVVDGDSLLLNGGEMIRLIGIDTPEASVNNKLMADIGKMGIKVNPAEIVALGREAARFAERLAQGKRCWLEFDRSEQDQHSRSIAYVHLEDGRVVNEVMIAQGYAKVYLSESFAYKQRYILMQTEARVNRRGLWGMEAK